MEKGRGQQGDAKLIAQQVERCRSIVRDLSAARAVESDAISEQSLNEVIAAATLDLPQSISIAQQVTEAKVFLPKLALTRTLSDLARNAAIAGTRSIVIRASVANERCLISIKDDGPGIAPAVLERLGEPYFTTKPDGLGLGLYLATVFTEALGGTIDVESRLGEGTCVSLDLPVRLR
jgi:two-component system sensor histidine kinase RegB